MIFTTYWFLLFAAILLPLYWVARWPVARLAVLVAGCVIFHGHFAGAAGVVPIIVLGVVTYFAARLAQPLWCAAGIVLCVFALLAYKYSAFLAHSILGVLDHGLADRAAAAVQSILPAAPPLAISFFAFEFVHYLYEVRRGRPGIRRPLDFLLFAIFFPSLVAGPIKRYGDFLPSLHRGLRFVSLDDVSIGLQRVALGFFKKTVLSDNLAAILNHYVPKFGQLALGNRWLLLVAIALRILFDFSGYSDIAIGLARMLGIGLPENFNWPYLSRSINEFWQRWHISLSTWIRDYIYIPLGGSRHGAARKVINGFIVFALCGLWHGAAMNFLTWGVFHGAGLAVCGTYRTLPFGAGARLGAAFDRLPLLGWALTIFFVCTSWLLFFYPLPQAWSMWQALFILGKVR